MDKKPLKICIVSDGIPPEDRAGAERVVWTSAQGLKQAGADITVITTTRRSIAVPDEKKVDGIRIISIPSPRYHPFLYGYRSLYNPAPVRHLQKILKHLQPDIIHIHNVHYHLSYRAIAVAKNSGAKVVMTLHDVMSFHYGKLTEIVDPANPVCQKKWNYKITAGQIIKRFRWQYNPFRNMVIRHYLRLPDKLLAVSQSVVDAVTQNGIRRPDVLYNAIDLVQWQPELSDTAQSQKATFIKRFGLEGKKTIFFGGRMGEAKGGTPTLAALVEVVKTVPEAVLLIAAEKRGFILGFLERAAAAGLEKNVICTGWLNGEELRAAYATTDVVIVPSLCFESFSMTALEAMALAKPVIASCFGGPTEVVENGVTGYCIHPLNIFVFSSKLKEFLTDTQKATTFGAAGRERAKRLFDLKDHVSQLWAMYSQLIQS